MIASLSENTKKYIEHHCDLLETESYDQFVRGTWMLTNDEMQSLRLLLLHELDVDITSHCVSAFCDNSIGAMRRFSAVKEYTVHKQPFEAVVKLCVWERFGLTTEEMKMAIWENKDRYNVYAQIEWEPNYRGSKTMYFRAI